MGVVDLLGIISFFLLSLVVRKLDVGYLKDTNAGECFKAKLCTTTENNTTKQSTCPVHKVGISRFSSKTGVYFLVRKSGFQLYLANSY